ncbi:hypothetical protein ABZY90_19700 [Streptomyces sp. NPDC006422]|uniref:hypothetical protein n=1 Tax=unclassified Streptomyces TaxID=2593676 RepID=UPI0033B5517A
MTHALRTARGCLLAAAALAAGALYVGVTESPWHSLPGLVLAAVLAVGALYSYAEHQDLVAACEQARQAALLEELDTVGPCCRLAYHSGGYAHGTDCTLAAGPFGELYAACCADAFVSRGTRHGPGCRANWKPYA